MYFFVNVFSHSWSYLLTLLALCLSQSQFFSLLFLPQISKSLKGRQAIVYEITYFLKEFIFYLFIGERELTHAHVPTSRWEKQTPY